jgi:hypothetical protein
MLLKLFHTIESKVSLLNSFYEVSSTLIPKPDGEHDKENYRSISLMNIDLKILNKVSASLIQKCIKKITCLDQVGFIQAIKIYINQYIKYST